MGDIGNGKNASVVFVLGVIMFGAVLMATTTTVFATTWDLVGTYTVNDLYNASGDPPWSPYIKNPYHSNNSSAGPYFIDAAPGHYKVDLMAIGDWAAYAYAWSGTADAGTSYYLGTTVGTSTEFDHNVGQIVLYTYDWWPWDNPPQNWSTFQLSMEAGSTPVPEPSTFILLGAGLASLGFCRRKFRK